VFGAHHVVGATVRLARYHGELGDSGFAVCIEKLCTMLDDPSVLLSYAGQKSGNVFQGHDRNVERIAEPYEPRCLHRRSNVQHPRQYRGLIGNDTNTVSAEL